jgi:hypothetical protein
LQSDFTLPVQQYIGESRLGSRNAIHFLHTLFSLYDELNGLMEQWLEKFDAKQEAGKMTINLPDDLLLAMQRPLITCWWTTGISCQTHKQRPSFLKNGERC